MELMLILFLFAAGIVLIVKGGDAFVDAASWFAEVSGIPKLIIGATIVSLATTLPEMLVSVMAALQGKVDMAIGNAVGSVTANIGLIMAISIICIPAAIRRQDYLMKTIFMLAASGLIVLCGFQGRVDLGISLILILIFLLFFRENLVLAKQSMQARPGEGQTAGRTRATRKELTVNILKFILGAAGIVLGAQLLVDNGSALARLAGISERVIGVTMIAIGTSLPELITTISAILKKESSLSVGNILGANIIDLTLILPISSLVSGKALPIAPTSAMLDLPACLLVGCVAFLPALVSQKFRRQQGLLLLALYTGYTVLTCLATAA